MKRFTSFLALCLAPMAFLSSCGQAVQESNETIDLVERIVSAELKAEHDMLAAFDAENCDANIVVVGEGDDVYALGRYMAEFDAFDNINASESADNLPDFSGEEISCVEDVTSMPYVYLYQKGLGDSLKVLTVKNALLGLKQAKLLVMDSPYMSLYGKDDLAALFEAVGTDVPVVYGTEVMLKEALSYLIEGSTAVGVITDSVLAESGLMGELASNVACVSISADSSLSGKSVLKIFLDKYSEMGYRKPLSCLLIEDYSFSYEALKADLDSLMNDRGEEATVYRKLLSEGFVLLDGKSVVAKECFKLMRERNIFTHNIHYPILSEYKTNENYSSLVKIMNLQ